MTESKVAIGIAGLNFGHLMVKELTQGRGQDLFRVAALCDLDLVKAEALAGRPGTRLELAEWIHALLDRSER